MKVLVVNAGSSSLKYQLFDTVSKTVLAKGICERIGIDGSRIEHRKGEDGAKQIKNIPMKDHTEATKIVVSTLTDPEVGVIKSMDEIEAVGHRIVHGGSHLTKPCLVTDEVIADLEKCLDIAPLHTAAHLMGIHGCMKAMPNTPQVLVIDTAFHSTMPEEAYLYPIPYKMYQEYKIRRYGFNGTSHRYVSSEMIKILGGKAEGTKIVTCHIGNGSSISAVKDGKVIDTSMGFTPLDGVIMGSRCGSIDPSIVTFIMKKEGFTPDEMSEFMNKKCGFLGVSEISSDSRDLEKAVAEGNKRAELPQNILAYQIKKYIGSYAAAMNGLDAIVFTAGIGENNFNLREKVCNNMEFYGIEIDKEINFKTHHQGDNVCISTPNSKVKVYVIPTNEELVIAGDAEAIVNSLK